jgi:DivIVA domain-containing protein
VVADTVVADTVVGAVSDAAGNALAAEVAEPEPYVPGSGARLPTKLRLVLAGYVGLACGLFAGGLACAAAAVFLAVNDLDVGLLSLLLPTVCISGFLLAFEPLMTRSGFSRLLRRPNDPRTATVTASKRGGSTLILDIPPTGSGRGYQSVSEVHLALWTKANMLVPGETVNVYRGSGKGSELLISSPQRGRAFLGTVKSQSALQPRLLDEKVSGVSLVDWAAWAASTTFSSTGLGYEMHEVDALRSAVRDTFLGVKPMIILGPPEVQREKKALSQPPVRSDEVRGKQFSTHDRGYDKTQVDAFVEAAGLRLAAMESTDRPAEALVNGDILFGWAEWVDSTTFETHPAAYDMAEVDAFRERIRDTFLGASEPPVRAHSVRGKQFSSTAADHGGYDKKQVAAFLDAAGIRLAAMESTDRPAGLSGAILAEWAEWADSTRFETTARLLQGYAIAEVDAFREELRDTFLGVSQPPVVSGHVRGKQFSTHRPGYDKTQVEAFLEKAAWRLAAMESTGAMESTEAMNWSPPPWAKAPLDKVSLIALITAIPGFVLVSIPLGIWGVSRTKNHQRRGRTLAVISFVLIGPWAIVGIVVGVMAAAPAPSGLDPSAVSTAPVAPSTVPGDQPHGPLRKAKRVSWDQLKTGDCFNGFADTAGWKDAAVSPTRVDCRSMHEEEVTGTFTLPGGRHYPSDLAVEDASDARCEKYFDRYVGIDWDSSDYFYDYLTPSPSDWRQGDHKAICLAYDPEHQETNKISLRNVKQ